MALDSIGELATHLILSKLGPEDLASLSCLNRSLQSASSSDDALWRKFCLQDLALTAPLGPRGHPCPSFKEAYYQWRASFAMYPWTLVKRVNGLWSQLRAYFNQNYPQVVETFQTGASEATLDKLERHLKVKFPLPTRVIYRFCDGQDPHHHHDTSDYVGLIGGYSFYDHFVNVDVLSTDQMVVETEEFNQTLGFSKHSKFVVVAASSTYTEKLSFLNCTNGQLYVGTGNVSTDGEMLPCVPSELLKSVHDYSGVQHQDGLLLWLEEHVRRLQSSMIKKQSGKFRSINLFPEEPPFCSTAVTHGVKIRASAVFVPEKTDLEDGVNNTRYYTLEARNLFMRAAQHCPVSGGLLKVLSRLFLAA